jgi:hypothetical protein
LIEKIRQTSRPFEQLANKLLKTLQKKIQQKQLKLQQQQLLDETIASNSSNLLNSSRFDLISTGSSSTTTSNNEDLNNLKNVFKSSNLSSSSSRSSSTSTNDDLISTNTQLSQNFQNEDDFPPFETHLENLYPYDILTIHPLEFARQITLMQQEIFKEIKPSELISLGWTKPHLKYVTAPNVSKLINLSNKLTYWYAKCIVDTFNLEERAAVISRLLDITHYFDQMNNFSGMMEISAALETSSVRRLEITRQLAGIENHKMYAKFRKLFDDHDKGYLDRFKKCSPPCIPFIGIHLSMIYRKNEHNKLNDENHKHNLMLQQQQHRLKNINESEANQTIIEGKTVFYCRYFLNQVFKRFELFLNDFSLIYVLQNLWLNFLTLI